MQNQFPKYEPPMLNRSSCAVLLSLLINLNLTGCATNSAPSTVVRPAQIPPPPAELMESPDLSETYSNLVRKLLLDWQQMLTNWQRVS